LEEFGAYLKSFPTQQRGIQGEEKYTEKPWRTGWAEVFVMAAYRYINLTERMKTARTRIRRGKSGQSLVEYALILVLVAIVAIVALFAVGLATQKNFGIIVGALGQKKNAGVITIEVAQCGVNHEIHFTGFWVTGSTDLAPSQLTVSADVPTVIGPGGSPVPLSSIPVTGGSGGPFQWNPQLAGIGTEDSSLCPREIVIQSKDGAIAVSPIEILP
jgi:Flp pilus assembly pilin Flp